MKAGVLGLLVLSIVAVGCSSTTNELTGPTPATPTVVGLTLSITSRGDRFGLARTWNYQATATARFSSGSEVDVTNSARWTSSNPSVATVSAGGAITGAGPGMTEIRAAYEGVSGGVFFCLEMECP